jgi:hypothetical protein
MHTLFSFCRDCGRTAPEILSGESLRNSVQQQGKPSLKKIAQVLRIKRIVTKLIIVIFFLTSTNIPKKDLS